MAYLKISSYGGPSEVFESPILRDKFKDVWLPIEERLYGADKEIKIEIPLLAIIPHPRNREKRFEHALRERGAFAFLLDTTKVDPDALINDLPRGWAYCADSGILYQYMYNEGRHTATVEVTDPEVLAEITQVTRRKADEWGVYKAEDIDGLSQDMRRQMVYMCLPDRGEVCRRQLTFEWENNSLVYADGGRGGPDHTAFNPARRITRMALDLRASDVSVELDYDTERDIYVPENFYNWYYETRNGSYGHHQKTPNIVVRYGEDAGEYVSMLSLINTTVDMDASKHGPHTLSAHYEYMSEQVRKTGIPWIRLYARDAKTNALTRDMAGRTHSKVTAPAGLLEAKKTLAEHSKKRSGRVDLTPTARRKGSRALDLSFDDGNVPEVLAINHEKTDLPHGRFGWVFFPMDRNANFAPRWADKYKGPFKEKQVIPEGADIAFNGAGALCHYGVVDGFMVNRSRAGYHAFILHTIRQVTRARMEYTHGFFWRAHVTGFFVEHSGLNMEGRYTFRGLSGACQNKIHDVPGLAHFLSLCRTRAEHIREEIGDLMNVPEGYLGARGSALRSWGSRRGSAIDGPNTACGIRKLRLLDLIDTFNKGFQWEWSRKSPEDIALEEAEAVQPVARPARCLEI